MTKSDRPRRIVVFAPHFAEYATRLALALWPHADVLLIREAKNLRAECDGLGLDPTRLPQAVFDLDYVLRRVSLRGRRETRDVVEAIERFRPDVIHVQEQGDRFTRGIAERFAPACPIVLTVHDPAPHSGEDTSVARDFAADLRRLRGLAAAYHVHGAACEGRLRAMLATKKPILATAHGTILLPFAPQPIVGRGFLFFGRMEAYKGIGTLLDAIDLLPPDLGIRVVFAGRGPELARHRARIAAHPAIEIDEAFLAPRDAIARFQAARAVLVPYRDATQSGVVSAAIGNGRPVIATRVGGLVDAVSEGETGLLVPPDDPARLAEAMRALLDDALAGRLAAGARAAAAGPFAWATIAGQLATLYQSVIGGTR